MFLYTKEEVKTFLETNTDNNQALKNNLTRKGFEFEVEGQGKNIKFLVETELIDPRMAEFGFKPKRPEYTRVLTKVLMEDFKGKCPLTWKDLSSYIKEHHEVSIAPQNLSTAYSELVAYGSALGLELSDRDYVKENGAQASEKDMIELRNTINFYVQQRKENPWVAWRKGLRIHALSYQKYKQLSQW